MKQVSAASANASPTMNIRCSAKTTGSRTAVSGRPPPKNILYRIAKMIAGTNVSVAVSTDEIGRISIGNTTCLTRLPFATSAEHDLISAACMASQGARPIMM
jgi:hypothetical protein